MIPMWYNTSSTSGSVLSNGLQDLQYITNAFTNAWSVCRAFIIRRRLSLRSWKETRAFSMNLVTDRSFGMQWQLFGGWPPSTSNGRKLDGYGSMHTSTNKAQIIVGLWWTVVNRAPKVYIILVFFMDELINGKLNENARVSFQERDDLWTAVFGSTLKQCMLYALSMYTFTCLWDACGRFLLLSLETPWNLNFLPPSCMGFAVYSTYALIHTSSRCWLHTYSHVFQPLAVCATYAHIHTLQPYSVAFFRDRVEPQIPAAQPPHQR